MIVVPLHAHVSDSERAIVQAAADRLAGALSEASGSPVTCAPVFVAGLDELAQAPAGAIRLASLLPELAGVDTPWPQAEARLTAACEALAASGDPLFLCTILRHAGDDEDAGLVYRRRVRIRRLDLLATELSRRTGAFVIDIDRVLADIGARNLEADYRLESPAARDVAAHAMALGLVANGLEARVPFDVQDRARELIAKQGATASIARELVPDTVISIGYGRRRQVIATVSGSTGRSPIGQLLLKALKFQAPPGEVVDRLLEIVHRHGLKGTGALAVAKIRRMVGGRRR